MPEELELNIDQLPFSMEAEQSVLGAILVEPECIAKVLELQKNSTPYIFLVGFRYEQPTGSSLFQSAAQDLMVGKASAEETCQIVQDGIASYYEPFQK